MAGVLKESQLYLHTLHSSINGMNHTCLFLPKLVLIHRSQMDGRLSWPGWLVTYQNEISVRYRELNLDTVTQLSTNRRNQARGRLTSLIENNALPLCQTI